ncbi:MAG: hypothetical protein JWQ95_3519, partial [Sphaerisporangium sp.]|nr:hypothetical protein [Sphaerisporangium sp.]
MPFAAGTDGPLRLFATQFIHGHRGVGLLVRVDAEHHHGGVSS